MDRLPLPAEVDFLLTSAKATAANAGAATGK